MNPEHRQELALLSAMARELCAWEEDLGGAGIPAGAAEPIASEGSRPTEPASRRAEAPRSAAPSSSSPESTPPTSNPSLPPDGRRRELEVLAEEAKTCTRCVLHEGRTKSVFARGNPESELCFVGEGPGFNEDKQGLPFVGRAGKLLDKMIVAMGYQPSDVYICNVVKCRPPNNRTPLPGEAAACRPYLSGQLALVKPKLIVALGRCAAEHLGCLGDNPRGWRGRWSVYEGIDVMPTYHPAFLLRNENLKRPVWQDLKKVMAKLRGVGS
ncbi:MAG: uracil-DNA glycosylase [Myxococcota bacterium]